MSQSQLPLEALPAWARLHDVSYHDVNFEAVENKGVGLVTSADLPAERDQQDLSLLLRVPHELVLSQEAVDEYSKVDHNFKQLLEIAGRQSSRGDILIYLLVHLVLSRRNQQAQRGAASTPWTEYIKFLARQIPVPTMWSSPERQLLQGTSLQSALGAKLSVLGNEFEEFREKSSKLSFWDTLLWDQEAAALDDWVLVDAWYRSRCLELPHSGDSMVPVLDMVNHSHEPTAYYEQDEEGSVQLCLRPNSTVAKKDEITISYGANKPAAEMLFSYGFIDKETATREMTLPLEPLDDDPLAKAKTLVFGQPGTVKISETDGVCNWQSPFAFLVCLNEEDGLEFRVLQDNEGNRQLKLFWQDEDVTMRVHDLEEVISSHPLSQLFQLRVVTVIHERVATQLDNIKLEISADLIKPLVEEGLIRQDILDNIQYLREHETETLVRTLNNLEAKRSELLENEDVLAYLNGANNDTEDLSQPATHDEDDFS